MSLQLEFKMNPNKIHRQSPEMFLNPQGFLSDHLYQIEMKSSLFETDSNITKFQQNIELNLKGNFSPLFNSQMQTV